MCSTTSCCEKIKAELDIKIEETDQGVKVNVTPKDPNKVNSFKGLLRNYKDFIGSDCSCFQSRSYKQEQLKTVLQMAYTVIKVIMRRVI